MKELLFSLLFTFHFSLPSRRCAGIACAEFGRVAFGERVDEFLMKVVEARGDGRRDALLVHLARTIYVFAQTFVEVSIGASLFDLLFIVEFDFGDEQACEAARVVVQTPLVIALDFDGQLRRVSRAAITSRAAEWSNILTRRHRLRLLDSGCRFV